MKRRKTAPRLKTRLDKSVRGSTVRVPVLAPLAIGIVVLLGVAVGGAYVLQRRDLDRSVHAQISYVARLFQARLEQDAQMLSGYTQLLMTDERLRGHWLAEDRPSLLQEAQPTFEMLREEYGVTHFYFHRSNRVCFLRVHTPQRRGDRIERATLEVARREGRPSWGIELGPLGTFTLRVVHPWVADGVPMGYVELGEEIDHILAGVQTTLDVDFVAVIDKTLLKRTGWEAGMKMLGREADWELSPRVAVIDTSLDGVSSELLTRALEASDLAEDRLFSWKEGGMIYRAGTTPLLDATGRRVGEIIVMKDVGAMEAALGTLSATLAVVGVFIGGALIIVFRGYLRRIECRLTTTMTDLSKEINRRRWVARELRDHKEHLEGKVNRRTFELQMANRQLADEVASRTEAQEALDHLNRDLERTVQKLNVSNRDIQDFLQVAAHDLKTPVRGLCTLADWLRSDYETCLDDQGRGYLELLAGRSRRLNGLIDRIVQYANIWSISRPKKEIDLKAFIETMADDIAPRSGIRIVCATELPTVIADPVHMAQLFRNLLDNAVKYHDKDEGLIILTCTSQGEVWEFRVSDNGPGIEPKYFEKIFKLFQTLSPRDEIETAGIGLAIVKRIVRLYQGRVWVESGPGQGCTFLFTLSKSMLQAETSAAGAFAGT